MPSTASNLSVCFVACIEFGLLEKKGRLLVDSIRTFAGPWRDASIYSFHPRAENKISDETRAYLGSRGVTIVDETLNQEFTDFPLANKWLALNWAQNNVTEDIIVFIDTDKMVLGPPAALLHALDAAGTVAARPADFANVAAESFTAENGALWRRLFDHFGIPQTTGESARVTTCIDQKQVFAYYNSGLMAARRDSGFYPLYADICNEIRRKDINHSTKKRFVDQLALSIAILKGGFQAQQLPVGYNYPFNSHNILPTAERVASSQDLITAHYHNVFETYPLKSWACGLTGFDWEPKHLDWLLERAAAHGLTTPPLVAAYRRNMKELRERIRIRTRLRAAANSFGLSAN